MLHCVKHPCCEPICKENFIVCAFCLRIRKFKNWGGSNNLRTRKREKITTYFLAIGPLSEVYRTLPKLLESGSVACTFGTKEDRIKKRVTERRKVMPYDKVNKQSVSFTLIRGKKQQIAKLHIKKARYAFLKCLLYISHLFRSLRNVHKSKNKNVWFRFFEAENSDIRQDELVLVVFFLKTIFEASLNWSFEGTSSTVTTLLPSAYFLYKAMSQFKLKPIITKKKNIDIDKRKKL